MKNGKIKFWIVTVLILLTAFADGLLTYIGTPDLAREGNPLVAYFGFGWAALFIANFVIISLVIIGARYAFVKYKSPLIPYEKYTEYSSMLFFNRPDKFIWTLIGIPKNWKPVFAIAGYALSICLIAGRIIVVSEWLIYLTNAPFEAAYNNFRGLFPYERFDVVFVAVLALILCVYRMYREFKTNKELITKECDL